jgi:hypothetical protein
MSDLQEVARRDASVSSLPPAPENVQFIGHPSPIVPQITRARGDSCSRVPVGYFDREGVSQLRRTLTHLSETVGGSGAVVSESLETLSVPTDGSFDFEKALRTIMKLYVVVSAPISSIALLNMALGGSAPVFSRESLG